MMKGTFVSGVANMRNVSPELVGSLL